MTAAPLWTLIASALAGAVATALLALWGYSRVSQRDRREHDRVRESLQISEERLRQAVLVAGIGVFEHDHRSDFIFASPEYRELQAFGPDEPITMLLLQKNLHADNRAEVHALIERTRDPAGDGRLDMAVHVHRRDGKELWLEVRAQTIFEGAGLQRRPQRTVGAVSDVTERILAEAQIRQLNAELEQRVRDRTAELEATVRELEAFSYSVSHDLRAPLRGIDGLAEVLADSQGARMDETGRDFVRRLRKKVRGMARLIDDLLKLASVNRGALVLRSCDLSLLAEAVAANLRESHPERRVELVIEPGLHARADLGLMKVVLDNLIGNAWKYSVRATEARVEIGSVMTEAGAAFVVRDNGVGFDMRHAAKLFTPFQRLHAAEQFEGTGVGLATVRRIVDRHGGAVWAEAVPDEGSSFYFSLGTKGAAEGQHAAQSKAAASGWRQSTPRTP